MTLYWVLGIGLGLGCILATFLVGCAIWFDRFLQAYGEFGGPPEEMLRARHRG